MVAQEDLFSATSAEMPVAQAGGRKKSKKGSKKGSKSGSKKGSKKGSKSMKGGAKKGSKNASKSGSKKGSKRGSKKGSKKGSKSMKGGRGMPQALLDMQKLKNIIKENVSELKNVTAPAPLIKTASEIIKAQGGMDKATSFVKNSSNSSAIVKMFKKAEADIAAKKAAKKAAK